MRLPSESRKQTLTPIETPGRRVCRCRPDFPRVASRENPYKVPTAQLSPQKSHLTTGFMNSKKSQKKWEIILDIASAKLYTARHCGTACAVVRGHAFSPYFVILAICYSTLGSSSYFFSLRSFYFIRFLMAPFARPFKASSFSLPVRFFTDGKTGLCWDF